MFEISSLRKNVPGIKGALLTRNKKVLAIDLELHEKRSLDRTIFQLYEGMYSRHEDARDLQPTENDRFFVFLRNSYKLGVVASQDVDIALLNTIVDRELDHGGTVLRAADTK
ncbi:MAG: hypothetical protein HXS52_01375 [Theionarchaea archaeon]|nr:hypothetical protein [Theionarchaea archaeon]MBU7036553.1 hypothetical protein [Theionarchaea archaeon]